MSASTLPEAALNRSTAVSLKPSFCPGLAKVVLSLRGGLAKSEAFAKSVHSLDLAQLAFRVPSTMHAQIPNGGDPFAKVKGLIGEMIARLKEEASANAFRTCIFKESLAERKGQVTTDTANLLLTEDALAEYAVAVLQQRVAVWR